jgi:hypothetical protein
MPSMQEQPVQSVIVSAEAEDDDGADRADGAVPTVTCTGYAFSGGGRGISRVEVMY